MWNPDGVQTIHVGSISLQVAAVNILASQLSVNNSASHQFINVRSFSQLEMAAQPSMKYCPFVCVKENESELAFRSWW